MKILVADDESLIRELLCDILQQENYQVETASNGFEVLELLKQHSDFSLVLLDVMMPGMDGIKTLRKIRETSKIPVILLTALGDSGSELKGLEVGANDYIKKPFHKKILLARINIAIKNNISALVEKEQEKQYGKLRIDTDACKIIVDGKECRLTYKEYQLLTYMYDNKNIVLSREQILEKIWGYDYEGDVRTIDTHIKMLRTDLGECGSYLRTIRGMGYMFEAGDEL